MLLSGKVGPGLFCAWRKPDQIGKKATAKLLNKANHRILDRCSLFYYYRLMACQFFKGCMC